MPGGVCAVLDYDVEMMAEYVAEMATRLTSDNAVAPAAFRKFISQILSSTRLPHTTILLGMNYLAKRINLMLLTQPRLNMSEGRVWRMLTVALLLGSKFLDDNTFQNRSWAEVSGIPVRELNALEFEWMAAIEWQLYVNLDRSEDYNAWLKSWQEWSDKTLQHQRAVVARERLTGPLSPVSLSPVDTEMARAHGDHSYAAWHQQQVAEYEHYERLSSLKRTEQTRPAPSYRPREPSWAAYPSQAMGWSNSPLTPPDSGYGTPEYINSAAVNAQYNDWFAHQAQQQSNRVIMGQPMSHQHQFQQQQQQQQQAQSQVAIRYHSRPLSSYPYNFYGHNIWDHNAVDSAPSVTNKPQPYFGMAAQGFGQPVMG